MEKSRITVDARGCGTGKTRSVNIPLIVNQVQRGMGALVVVPSMTLQQQYSTELDRLSIKHHLVNSNNIGNSESVADRLIYLLVDVTNVIIITHQAFVTTRINPEYRNRLLIIDEALDCYSSELITLGVNSDPKSDLDQDLNLDDDDPDSGINSTVDRKYFEFKNVFKWHDHQVDSIIDRPKTRTQPYFELDVYANQSPSLLNKGPQWRRITNPNVRLWTTWSHGQVLINNRGSMARLLLELNPDILDHYPLIHISAASFDKTSMGIWAKFNRIDYEVIYKFEPHCQPLIMHMPPFELSWSKNLRKLQPDTIRDFVGFIKSTIDSKIIYVANNKLADHEQFVFKDGDQLTHNAHGLNDYREYRNFAHISAIKPHAFVYNFYRDHLGLNKDQISFVFSANTSYQLLMRTALREPDNTLPVHMFVLDTTMAFGVLDQFDPSYYQVKLDVPIIDVRNIEAIKKYMASGSPEELAFYAEILTRYEELINNRDQFLLTKPKIRRKRKPKLYTSNAQKQRAYRERKNLK